MADNTERREFVSVDDALRQFPWWPTANLDVIRETVAGLEIARIYTPPGRSYIGLIPEDGGPIVSLHFGYIAGLRDEQGKRFWRELPVNRIRDGDSTRADATDGDPCPECWILLPINGPCGYCY